MSSSVTKVLVVSGEPIGHKRAGPAVRALAIAEELKQFCDARLLSTATQTKSDFSGQTIFGRKDVSVQVEWAEIIIFQGYFLTEFPWVVHKGKYLVADLYAPFQLEHLLEIGGDATTEQLKQYEQTIASVNWQLRNADFFLCASEKQRDFWLGQLAAVGRINPLTINTQRSVSSLVALAPFGTETVAGLPLELKLRDQIGASATDKILIWGGGIYDWFDPLTLIRAMGILHKSNPAIKLFFMAVHHPNQNVHKSELANECIALCQELGLLNQTVYFNSQWIPFEERAAFLRDADIGISVHGEHIESQFSFRTRMLDYIWAGLPIVCSDGDSFADVVREYGIGRVVPVGDPVALAASIESILFETGEFSRAQRNIINIQEQFTWTNSLKELVTYCTAPYKAADYQHNWKSVFNKPHLPRPRWTTFKRTLREEGVRALLGRVLQKIRGNG